MRLVVSFFVAIFAIPFLIMGFLFAIMKAGFTNGIEIHNNMSKWAFDDDGFEPFPIRTVVKGTKTEGFPMSRNDNV